MKLQNSFKTNKLNSSSAKNNSNFNDCSLTEKKEFTILLKVIYFQ